MNEQSLPAVLSRIADALETIAGVLVVADDRQVDQIRRAAKFAEEQNPQ